MTPAQQILFSYLEWLKENYPDEYRGMLDQAPCEVAAANDSVDQELESVTL